MRLGARATVLQTMNCITAKLYQKETHVEERHRHRWGAGAGGGPGCCCCCCLLLVCLGAPA
jgi:hypothetical protein